MDKTSSDDREIKLTSGKSSESVSSSISSGSVIWRGTAVSTSAALDLVLVMTQSHPGGSRIEHAAIDTEK